MAILIPLFGIFTSFLLLYYLSALNRSNIFLALFFLCCNLVVLVYFGLHYTHNIFWEGVCFVHWLPLSYLLGPLLFYYTKTTLSETNKLDKWDWIHLIPAALTIINTLPFTTLPFEEKAKIANHIINVSQNYTLNFLFASFEFILISRSVHLLLYSIGSIIYFNRISRQALQRFGRVPSNHSIIKRWILLLGGIQIIIASNSLLHMLTVFNIHFSFESKKYAEIFSTKDYYFGICGGGFLLQNLCLFLFPKILYGNVSYSIEEGKSNIIENLISNLPKKAKETFNFQGLEDTISNYLVSKPYIQKDFSLSQIAFDLKISERVLSNYFNNELNTTFSDWRKKLRIDYVCELIEQGAFETLTIEAIASNAGFVSRSKFNEAFKEIKGITPSAYIKNRLTN